MISQEELLGMVATEAAEEIAESQRLQRQTDVISRETMIKLIGPLPYADGFDWNRAEFFRKIGGAWHPYSGFDVIPGPGLMLEVKIVPLQFPSES